MADNLAELFKEITDLGTIEALPDHPSLAGARRFKVTTATAESELLDLFTFHVAREQVAFFSLEAPAVAAQPATPVAAAAAPAADAGFGFFDDALAHPKRLLKLRLRQLPQRLLPCREGIWLRRFDDAPGAPAARRQRPLLRPQRLSRLNQRLQSLLPHGRKSSQAATLEASTIRVSVEKVDQLINLVGELVITCHAGAKQPGFGPRRVPAIGHRSDRSDRNTRDLQEAVASIRMIPMSTVFSRFPRMLRDLANKLGKKVELVTQGEATELDKGLVEKITDLG